MDREGGNKEKIRKYRECIFLHFLILSPFPLHFLILTSFPLHFLILSGGSEHDYNVMNISTFLFWAGWHLKDLPYTFIVTTS